MVLLVLLGINLTSNAQVCNIKGGNGASVEVFSATIEENGSMVYVTVSNDSNDINANITVNITVTYGNVTTRTRTYSGKCRVPANASPIIKIPITERVNGSTATSVTVDSISGNRCE